MRRFWRPRARGRADRGFPSRRQARGRRPLVRAAAADQPDDPGLHRARPDHRRASRWCRGAARVAHFEAQGQMDLEAKTPMRKDAIFRMASMSKPITGVAILMLMEEGKLRLTDPVSRFIPEFKNTKVAIVKTPGAAGDGARQPAREAGDLHGARRPRHHGPRSADAHLGPGERRRGLARGRALAPRSTSQQPGGLHAEARRVPLDFQPGTAVALQRARRHRNARPHRRSRVGPDVRSVPQAAHLRSARDERHGVLPDRRSRCRAWSRSTTIATASW